MISKKVLIDDIDLLRDLAKRFKFEANIRCRNTTVDYVLTIVADTQRSVNYYIERIGQITIEHNKKLRLTR